MSEKSIELEEEKKGSVEEASSNEDVEGKSSHRDTGTEYNDGGSTKSEEVTERGFADAFVTERADPSKVKEWRKSKEAESVLSEIPTNKFMIDLDLESEDDMKELEEVVLAFHENREKQYDWEPQYINLSKIRNDKELKVDERDDIDKALYMKILVYGWLRQGKINRALEWGKREAEMENTAVTRNYAEYYHIISPFCHGFSLGEIAQYVNDLDWLLNNIYETAREVRNDRGREDNLAAIAGAYALRGDLTTARNIMNDDIQYSKRAMDKARAQLAIALGKRGYIDEACDIIEDLPKASGIEGKEAKRRAMANLEVEILEEKGADYLVELFVDMPWVQERLGKLIGKLKVKGEKDMARELAFAAVNHPPLLESIVGCFESAFEMELSECKEILGEGQIHKDLRKKFLDRGFLISEKAQLSKKRESQWGDGKTWIWLVSEGGLLKYIINKRDDKVGVSKYGKKKKTPATIFSNLMDETSIPNWIKRKYGQDENTSDNKNVEGDK